MEKTFKLCDYGCGKEAKYTFKNGKVCCSKYHSCCQTLREKNRKGNIGKVYSEKTKKLMSIIKKGPRNPMYGKKGSSKQKNAVTLSIKKIRRRYPFFSKVEKMRYNPDRPDEKEIQVHCKNHKCENSKEKGGWFTPTYIQLYERIRQLEKDCGQGGCYLYCSQDCKNSCILYNLKSDPFQEIDLLYTQEEYNIWKQTVLEQDNYQCQMCGSKENLHCHHIVPIKENEMLALDPDNGIVLCQKCHYEIGHKTGTECSTGNLGSKQC